MTTVREAVFELLRERSMTTVFGNPGSTELPMLTEFPVDFRYVLGLQEATVVGLADGYAQASGRPTLVNLHTAPGVGNAMGAIFNAQANKSPLVITAGQQYRSLMTLQANLTNRDAMRMPHPLVKWSYEPPRAEDVPHALARAIHMAALPPRGPSFLSIPMDDWGAEVDEGAVRHQSTRSVAGAAQPGPEAIAALAERLRRAERPALVAGPEIDASGRLGGGDPPGRAPAPARVRDARPGRRADRLPRGSSALPGHPAAGGAACRGNARRPRSRAGGGHVGLSLLPQRARPAPGRGHRTRGRHERPRRGRSRADGRRDRGRPGAHARRPGRHGRRVRAQAPARAPGSGAGAGERTR